MKPTIGRIVIYKLRDNGVDALNNGSNVAPAVITRVWTDTCVNLKVVLDAPFEVWRTSVMQGDGESQWQWPERTA